MDLQVEDVTLPNKPVSNFEIEDAVKKLKIRNFRGVFLRDTLPKRARDNENGIMNLENTCGSGTHWVAWFNGGNDKFYSDSCVFPPPTELTKYLNRYVFYPTEQIQPRQEVFCGHLCLFVLKEMHKGKGLQEMINSFW